MNGSTINPTCSSNLTSMKNTSQQQQQPENTDMDCHSSHTESHDYCNHSRKRLGFTNHLAR